VAYATSVLPGWITVIDRSSASVFASARRSLYLEVASIVGALLLILGLLFWVYRRANRIALADRRRNEIGTELTRALADAAAPGAVADALATALAAGYRGALAVVGLPAEGTQGLTLASVRGKALLAHDRERPSLLAPAAAAYEDGERLELSGHAEVGDRFPELQRDSARHVGAVYATPIISGSGRKLGAVSLLFDAPRRLSDNDRAAIAAHVAQAVQALSRSLRQEREHEVAVELQRSLLPEELPAAAGLEFATRYHAGGVGVEVGGDWYDVVRRPDGLVHVSVGDVAGRGIPAATLMAQLRNAFRAYALDHTSPAEITRRLLRHVPDNGMVTTACLTFDPYTRAYAYSLAGHPPILLLDRASGVVVDLKEAGAPPLGFASPESIVEQPGELPPGAVLVAYTDGLVERRGAAIDDGIGLVASILAAHGGDDAEQIADDVLGGATAETGADDDAALIVVDTGDVPAQLDIEIPADPAVMASVRRRLQRWMTLRGIGESERSDAVLAVHEACINAIEHGYQLEGGTIRVLLDHAGDLMRIHVEDYGQWRPPTPDPSRGRGIQIMETAMHETRIEHGRNGTTVALAQRLPVP
jgi:serine phosphatase RsbU (regulator of sigma subunit)/anti-sigma regulatory factor (Ser/Thr protein kinase)